MVACCLARLCHAVAGFSCCAGLPQVACRRRRCMTSSSMPSGGTNLCNLPHLVRTVASTSTSPIPSFLRHACGTMSDRPKFNKVPELLAKKRKRDETQQAQRAAAALQTKKNAKAKRATLFRKAEQFVKEYRQQEGDAMRVKRTLKSKGGLMAEPGAKLVFVIRIRGISKMHPKSKKVLQLLRLRQMNSGVFLRVNKATLGLLKLVEPFVSYGYPSLKSVKELIYKRGYAKVKDSRVPLTDNKVIEERLGKCGIICMEDLVHEIFTVGPHFKEASNFLWPFKLSPPKGEADNKRSHFVEGGQAGNRQELINDLIAKMN